MIITGKYPSLRLRRNRKSDWSRRLTSENNISSDDLILPIFLVEGKNKKIPFSAVMNLGPHPTVDPTSPSAVEVHLLDQEIDLIGKELLVEPVLRLREQKRFANLEALSTQIGLDAKLAKSILQHL